MFSHKIWFVLASCMVLAIESQTTNKNDDDILELAQKMLKSISQKLTTKKNEIKTRFETLEKLHQEDVQKVDESFKKETLELKQNHDLDVRSMSIAVANLSSAIDKKFRFTKDALDKQIQKISDTQRNISRLVEDSFVKMENNSRKYADEIERVETDIADLTQDVSSDLHVVKTSVEKNFDAHIRNIKVDFANKMATMQQQFSTSIKDNQKQIGDLEKKSTQPSTWPSGKYCIFKSGPCPAGFTAKNGFLKALIIYSTKRSWITATTFGDSSLRCHGSCGQYGSYAEINLSTCCK